jgi:Fur family ferric uptake transcriptional regulator
MNRKTRQRKWIRHVFETTRRPLRPQEVLELAQKHVEGLGIATVYRNLKSFSEEGLLSTVELPGQPTHYEIAGLDPHHHFQCDQCNKVFNIPAPNMKLGSSVPKNFRVKRQEVVLYGQCSYCAPAKAS